jgi:valyl-tRNA synthetase
VAAGEVAAGAGAGEVAAGAGAKSAGGGTSPLAGLIEATRIEDAGALAAALAGCGAVPDEAQAGAVEAMKAFVSQARALKAEHGLASRRDVRLLVKSDARAWDTIEANLAKLQRMAGASAMVRQDDIEGAPAVVTPLGTLGLDLASAIDAAAERPRLARELAALAGHIAGTEARLANPAFVGKAPPAVLEGARRQLAELHAKRSELERLLASLG